MDPSEISPEFELTVRNHIRQTFLPYARKHITKGHVAYTESKLEQEKIFTESLDFIPLVDPHALVLPPDPLDTFIKSLDSLELAFEERWTTDADAVHKLKTILKTIVGEGRELCSDACWRENDHTYTRLAEIYRPMTPILTNLARQQTPKPGSSALRASLPRTQPVLFEHIAVKSVVVEQVKESDVPTLEDILDLRPTMDTATRSYILSRFKLANPPAQSTQTNVYITSFLRADSPPRQIPLPLSPPLFFRSKVNSDSLRTRIGSAKDIIDRLHDVPALVPEELDGDMGKVNMTIVDGWATLPISSPPSASPVSSQDTDIDELWEDSPTMPSTPATSLFGARMDDVEIPRIHKPGHALPSTPGPRGSISLKSLMAQLKPTASRKEKEDNCTTPAKQRPRLPFLLCSTDVEDGRDLDAGDSMLGQPPSICAASSLTTGSQRHRIVQSKCDSDSEDFEMDMERGLDVALRQVYHEVQEKNIEACVLDERLDEKDVALMDVPHLPQPTVHPGASFQPASLRALICGSKAKAASLPPHITLQAVKGIKPLNLELSWRPFKFTPPIPTDESVTLVEGSALEDLEKLGYTNKTSETKIYGALQDLETVSCRSGNVAGSRNFDNIRGTGNIGLSPPRLNKPILEDQGLELVLTKRERRLLAGLSEFETRQEYRGEEQQDEASLVTEDHDQPIDGNEQLPNECPPDLLGDRHLRSSLGDSHPAFLFLHSDGQKFTCGNTQPSPVFHSSGVLDSVPGAVDRSDVPDDNMSCGSESRGVVFNDSGVALPILDHNGGCYCDQVAGDPRYLNLNTIYSPEDIDDSDGSKANKLYYMCDRLQDRQQDRDKDQGSFSLSLSIQHQHGAGSSPRRAVGGYDQDQTGFFPLSFGSQTERESMDPIGPAILSLDNDEERIRMLRSDNDVKINESPSKVQDIRDKNENVSSFLQYFVPEVDPSTATVVSKRRRLDDSKTTTIATRELLDDHLALRNKPVKHVPPPATIPMVITSQPQFPQTGSGSPPGDAPPEFLDVHTIRLPNVWDPPATSHWYLASMALIQKRALLQALRAPECQVHLVERYALGGVDVVMDPDTAVLFAPLLALPFQVEGLTDRISQASWRHTHIMVILEAFPSGDALIAKDGNNNGTNGAELTPYAFSPPILKAVKKLRRLLSIADGFSTKNAGCEVHWAFASDVGEAALFVRIFGDLAAERALREDRNALWGDRGWLQVDEHEDESDLATVEGMNPFAAFVMLYQKSLQDILDMSPEQRAVEFSSLVGCQRIASLNAIIEQRAREMDVDAATESGVGDSGISVEMDGSTQY